MTQFNLVWTPHPFSLSTELINKKKVIILSGRGQSDRALLPEDMLLNQFNTEMSIYGDWHRWNSMENEDRMFHGEISSLCVAFSFRSSFFINKSLCKQRTEGGWMLSPLMCCGWVLAKYR